MTDPGPVLTDPPFDESVLVSPPFSCGAGLVVDILLRLQIRVRPPGAMAWTAVEGGFAPSDALRTHYARHAPSIVEQAVFAFPDRKSMVFEHRMDLAGLPARSHVMIVRDPVDAVFSWHRRWNTVRPDKVPFERYLRNFSAFQYHLPHGALLATPLDTYALFVLFWALAADDVTVVRYEDLKTDPVPEVMRILETIGAERSEAAVAEAARRSAFDAVGPTARHLPEWSATNLRSRLYEWRERMSRDERAALTAHEPIASVCRLLSYEAPEGDGDIFEHRSVCGMMLGAAIRALRGHFPDGLSEPAAYCAACAVPVTAVSARIRKTLLSDLSLDADDMDAMRAALIVLRLLPQIFREAPPQPVERLERLVLGMSAALANAAPHGGMRHMPGDIVYDT